MMWQYQLRVEFGEAGLSCIIEDENGVDHVDFDVPIVSDFTVPLQTRWLGESTTVGLS